MVTFSVDAKILSAMMSNCMAISEEMAADQKIRYTEDVLIQVERGVLTIVSVGMYGAGVASCKVDVAPDASEALLIKRDKTPKSKEVDAFGYLPDGIKTTQKSGPVFVEIEDGAFISLTQDGELIGEVADSEGNSGPHDKILGLTADYTEQMERGELRGVQYGTARIMSRIAKLTDPTGPKDTTYFRMSQVNTWHMYLEVGPHFQGVISMVKPEGAEEVNERIRSYWDDDDAGHDGYDSGGGEG